MKMQLLLVILYIVSIALLYIELAYCVCASAEYEINGHCCPMCAPGNRVLWHCTVDTSTTCESCSASTYTDEPNGLEMCFSCSTCDAGLRIQKACTRLSNTICEPLKGFFCMVREKGSCKLAVKHSQCNPGEYIQQKGTASTDTVCGECTNGTYSDGTFTACQPHTICQSMGGKQIETGTTSSDAKFKGSSRDKVCPGTKCWWRALKVLTLSMDLMLLITFQPVKVKQKEKLYLLLKEDKLVTESEKTIHTCSLAYIIK
uniref:Tumor necrosis factor receptor superfamily member 14-like n=1 Tax=Cyprinus carpio TaxID=7962 RepID=A0A8C2JWM3_CYPCA